MKIADINKQWLSTLTPILGEGEAKAVVREIFENFLGMSPVDVALHPTGELEDFTVQRLHKALEEIAGGKPVQYVTGHAWFHGLRLEVNPNVLIPRRETSQLVDIIEHDFGTRSDLRILDLCTGSGAIALALARALPFPSVTAVDNSAPALDVARANATKLRCKVNFVEADVLCPDQLPATLFDIIVSNPPYIPEAEKDEVDANVLNFEPHRALFVPDSQPLLFYEVIANYAKNHLAPGGKLYFEINPHFATQLKQLLTAAGFSTVYLLNDMFNRMRFAVASI